MSLEKLKSEAARLGLDPARLVKTAQTLGYVSPSQSKISQWPADVIAQFASDLAKVASIDDLANPPSAPAGPAEEDSAPLPPGVVDIQGRIYATVGLRLTEFRRRHPGWTIETEIIGEPEREGARPGSLVRSVRFRARIHDDTGRLIATGHAEELAGGRIPALEKAETSAVGRALANAGWVGDATIQAGPSVASADEVLAKQDPLREIFATRSTPRPSLRALEPEPKPPEPGSEQPAGEKPPTPATDLSDDEYEKARVEKATALTQRGMTFYRSAGEAVAQILGGLFEPRAAEIRAHLGEKPRVVNLLAQLTLAELRAIEKQMDDAIPF